MAPFHHSMYGFIYWILETENRKLQNTNVVNDILSYPRMLYIIVPKYLPLSHLPDWLRFSIQPTSVFPKQQY